nr:MAG: ORF1 [Torque teno polar bear virus 24]
MAWRRRRWRRRRLRRPRRRWRFRRRGRTYRRRYGGRRRVFRSRFRGYRRRAAVRRRRFRRKRQYKSVVTQWNPQHRVGCRIKGWLPMIMSIKGHFGEKSEVFTQSSDVPDTYIQCGGGVSWRHFTLGMFYQEHKLFRNRWSHTNVGYDLARYFGTKLRFWPHPWIDYLVYWETSFEMPERSEMSELHPANLLLIPKRMLIRSKQHRGRRRKLFIKPPPVHTNQWYFMKTWCNIPLFKVGIVPVNFNNSFLHTQTQYGVWIGYLSGAEVPVTIAWSQIDIAGQWPINCQTDQSTGGPKTDQIAMSPPNGGDKTMLSGTGASNTISVKEAWRRRVYYRWWWDDGVDNYIMVNKYNRNPIYDGMNSCEIQKVDMPYWKYFFGLPYLTSAQSNPQLCVPGMNPSVYALTWYADTECQTMSNEEWHNCGTKPVWPPPDSRLFGYPDQDLCGPGQIPAPNRKRKYWVFLSQAWPWIMSSSKYVKSWRLPDYDEAREQLTRLVGSGPFVVNAQDVTFATRTLNLGMSYTSFWQWGGFRPSPDTTEDPCKIGDPNPPFPSKDRFAVQVEDPSLAEKITMHPWDFEQSGLYTQLALKRLISDVYPELSTEPPSVGQPPDRPLEPRNKFRRIEGSRSPAESSGSSDNSSWADAASPSPSEAEETPPLQGPPMRKQRKRQHRSWKLERQRQRGLVRFLETSRKIKSYRP